MQEKQLVSRDDGGQIEHAVKAEQIRLLYHQGTPIQLLGVVTAIIAVAMFRDVVEPAWLAAWLTAMVIVTALRLSLNYRFSRVSGKEVDIDRWGKLYILGSLVSGVVWGSLSLFYDPAWPVAHQIILFAIYSGIIAGAFNTHSSLRWAFPAFFLPPVLMLMYVMLVKGNGFGELALLFVIYICLMAISSRRYYQRLLESLRVRVVNESLAQALEESNQRLMQLSEIDELTQLYNRRSMDRFMQKEWERHIRYEKPFSLLFIDIDYFKQYNDTYGHLKGDEVLVRAAAIFGRYAQRATDMAARFGGEEFAIILPATSHADAMWIAESVRETVEADNIEHMGSQSSDSVTVSIGVATMTPGQGSQFDVLKSEADRTLYQAKAQGRNRVVGLETMNEWAR